MKTYKNVQTDTNVEDEIFCNFCGEKILKNAHGYVADHVSVVKQWGYGSRFDSLVHSFEICEDCFEIMLGKMKISPSTVQ